MKSRDEIRFIAQVIYRIGVENGKYLHDVPLKSIRTEEQVMIHHDAQEAFEKGLTPRCNVGSWELV